jgi:hypothetical protein
LNIIDNSEGISKDSENEQYMSTRAFLRSLPLKFREKDESSYKSRLKKEAVFILQLPFYCIDSRAG